MEPHLPSLLFSRGNPASLTTFSTNLPVKKRKWSWLYNQFIFLESKDKCTNLYDIKLYMCTIYFIQDAVPFSLPVTCLRDGG